MIGPDNGRICQQRLGATARLKADFIHMNKWLAPFLSPYLAWRGVLLRYVFSVNSRFEVRLFSLFGVNGFTTDTITLPDKFD